MAIPALSGLDCEVSHHFLFGSISRGKCLATETEPHSLMPRVSRRLVVFRGRQCTNEIRSPVMGCGPCPQYFAISSRRQEVNVSGRARTKVYEDPAIIHFPRDVGEWRKCRRRSTLLFTGCPGRVDARAATGRPFARNRIILLFDTCQTAVAFLHEQKLQATVR